MFRQRLSTLVLLLAILVIASVMMGHGIYFSRKPLVAAAAPAQQGLNRAAVVVRFSDADVRTRCVSFSEPVISGEDLLLRSGFSVEIDREGNVCRIETVGCPASNCYCQCPTPECLFWGYFHLRDSGWVFSFSVPLWYDVYNGSVEGWSWGAENFSTGVPPPLIRFDEVCPPLSVEPTSTATSAPATAAPTAIVPTATPPTAAEPTVAAPTAAAPTTTAPTTAPSATTLLTATPTQPVAPTVQGMPTSTVATATTAVQPATSVPPAPTDPSTDPISTATPTPELRALVLGAPTTATPTLKALPAGPTATALLRPGAAPTPTPVAKPSEEASPQRFLVLAVGLLLGAGVLFAIVFWVLRHSARP